MASKLGILAGGGELPARLVEACHACGRPVFVVAFEGHTDPATVAGVPHIWSRLGAAGAILDRLHAEGVREIVFAGPVRRPSFAELRPDWRATAFFAKLGLRALGHDGLLRAVSNLLEEEGFRVVAAHEILDVLLTPAGPVGSVVPDAQAEADIAQGIAIAKALGALDVGQAVIVQQGLVLGVEAIEGTDALIARCGTLRREGVGGVLVKVRKPQQDNRFDLPTIGAATVGRAHAAGLRGIAVEARGSLILGRERVAEAADRAGMFVVGVDAS